MTDKKRTFEAELRPSRTLTLQPEPGRDENQDPAPRQRLSPSEFPFTRELILRLIERIKRS